MAITTDPEDYRRQWERHINQFERLKLALPEEYHDDLADHQDGLTELVDEAVAAAADQEGEN